MYEWDQASYARKFGYTIANCRVGAELSKWTRVTEIGTDGLVYVRDGDDPIGEVIFEQKGDKQTKYPLLTFNYVPIQAGFYAHTKRTDWFYILQRRHLKSFKIGLSGEGYEIWEVQGAGGMTRKDYRAEINLDKPIDRAEFKRHKILGNSLVIDGKALRAYGTTIAFLEAGRAILKDPAFKPLVKPYLGDAWEIVDL